MKKEYELSLEDYMYIRDSEPEDTFIPVNTTNLAWHKIAEKYGFDPDTVEPIDYYRFTAESVE